LSATWVAFICALLGAASARSQAPQASPGAPVIRSIEVEYTGPETVSKERILAQMRMKVGQPFSSAMVEQDVEALYKSGAVLNVNEGAKGAVSQIRFEGNLHFSDWRLRKEMKTKRKTIVSFIDKSGRLDEAQLQQDLDSIREWYQNHGFIDVEIKDVRRERNTKGALTVTIVIAEGPQYHVGKVTVSGEKVAKEESIRALLKMKEGSVYSP